MHDPFAASPSLFDRFSGFAFIFDKDGTLVDTESIWFEAYRRLLAPYGFEHTTAVHRLMMGLSAEDCVVVLQRAHAALPRGADASTKLLSERMQSFRQVRQEVGVQPLPGVHAFLSRCAERQIVLAMATSAMREDTDVELDQLGWRQFFRIIVTADDVARHKPEPDIYLEAARRLAVEPSRCLAFEDGLNGIKSAQAAGMPVVFLRDPRFGIEAPAGVAVTVNHFTELI